MLIFFLYGGTINHKEIWLKRCEITIKQEQKKKIFAKEKKEKKEKKDNKIKKNKYSNKNNSNDNTIKNNYYNNSGEFWCSWILNGIKYGNNWRDFCSGSSSTDSLSVCS